MKTGEVIAFIPARYESTRFPGKPLARIADKTMVEWVYRGVEKALSVDAVYVATDDRRIEEAVISFGGSCVMTSPEHESGTDRIAECIDKLQVDDDAIVLNIQGDEPLIQPGMAEDLVSAFEDDTVLMATLKNEIKNSHDLDNHNVVKVECDLKGDAIAFSRLPIPFDRDKANAIKRYRHVGMYAYKAAFLRIYPTLPRGPIEASERLEQMRALENGYKIRVVQTIHESIGVDTPAQLESVRNVIERNGGMK